MEVVSESRCREIGDGGINMRIVEGISVLDWCDVNEIRGGYVVLNDGVAVCMIEERCLGERRVGLWG